MLGLGGGLRKNRTKPLGFLEFLPARHDPPSGLWPGCHARAAIPPSDRRAACALPAALLASTG